MAKDARTEAGKEDRHTRQCTLAQRGCLARHLDGDEGYALSRVLTPGFDSRNDWKSYTHNSRSFRKSSELDAPPVTLVVSVRTG